MRSGSRKKLQASVKIKFCDDTELQEDVYDISTSGFSIASKQQLSLVHKKFPATINLSLLTKDSQEITINTTAKFVRAFAIIDDYQYLDYNLLAFKFLNLAKEQSLLIKDCLIKSL